MLLLLAVSINQPACQELLRIMSGPHMMQQVSPDQYQTSNIGDDTDVY